MKLLFFILLLPIVLFSEVNSDKENNIKYNNDTIIYSIDNEKSRIDWYCDIHNGYIKLDSGNIKMYNGEIVSGRFVICMESVFDLDIDNYELMKVTLENTLKSVEFFNTVKFHTSDFEFDDAIVSENGYEITGELRLMNVSQCINFGSEFIFDDDSLMITSDSIIIDRTHWGITSMSKNDAKSDKSFIVPNDIGIVVHLIMKKN